MEELDILKGKITELAIKHNAAGNDLENLEESSWLEEEALMLIADLCEKTGRIVEGFTHDKRELAKTNDYYDDEYFCLERFQLYVDTISIESTIVGDLNWHYVNSFWPGTFENKKEFIDSIYLRIQSGVFYDVKF